jgi:hypothetical protein
MKIGIVIVSSSNLNPNLVDFEQFGKVKNKDFINGGAFPNFISSFCRKMCI